MPGVLIPDNDPVAVYEAAGEAVARARRGGGPSLIEVKTDRLFGHFEGDPQVYRTKEEMALLTERDALRAFERRLVDTGVLDGADAQARLGPGAGRGGRGDRVRPLEPVPGARVRPRARLRLIEGSHRWQSKPSAC